MAAVSELPQHILCEIVGSRRVTAPMHLWSTFQKLMGSIAGSCTWTS